MFENELFCLCDLNVITKYPWIWALHH
jgi:hypothetical protein